MNEKSANTNTEIYDIDELLYALSEIYWDEGEENPDKPPVSLSFGEVLAEIRRTYNAMVTSRNQAYEFLIEEARFDQFIKWKYVRKPLCPKV